MYCFEISFNIWIYPFSKVFTITGIDIVPHIFTSVFSIMLSTLSKLIKAIVQLFASVVDHLDHPMSF